MQLIGTMPLRTGNLRIGDYIGIYLNGFGVFNATAHKTTDNGVLFIFDEYVASCRMNYHPTSEGGFNQSDLNKWLNDVLLPAFPKELKQRISNLSIPSVGEIFGHDDPWLSDVFEADADEQLPLMKQRCNRVAYYNGQLEWGWLRNVTSKIVSSASFADITCCGSPGYRAASGSGGVRPEFWLNI